MKMINVSSEQLKKETTPVKTQEPAKTQINVQRFKGNYFPRIRSRHPSHDVLRKMKNSTEKPLGGWNTRVYIRFGSSTSINSERDHIIINDHVAISRSSNKEESKKLFLANNIPTPRGFVVNNINSASRLREINSSENYPLVAMSNIKFPIIAKPKRSSRGRGLVLIESQNDLSDFLDNFTRYMKLMKLDYESATSYIFEEYMNYAREYRLHVFATGECIYTNRKMIKSDVPDDQRFYRNDNNSVWYLETNPQFDKPVNFDAIIRSSVEAVKAVGLDFGAVDVRVQSGKNGKGQIRSDVKYTILEINSAPSFGEGTAEAYKKHLPNLIASKLD